MCARNQLIEFYLGKREKTLILASVSKNTCFQKLVDIPSMTKI